MARGGIFYLVAHPHNSIHPTEWKRALSDLLFELEDRIGDANHVFYEDGPVAFDYVDPHCQWRGRTPGAPPHPKSLRLCREWGERAIQSHLGGRRRSNWSNVAWVCQFLCDEFPRQLALVVSEGMGRYDDRKGTTVYGEGAILYYEGTGFWKDVDLCKWPWTSMG